MSKVTNLDKIIEEFGPHLHDAPYGGWRADRVIDKIVPTHCPYCASLCPKEHVTQMLFCQEAPGVKTKAYWSARSRLRHDHGQGNGQGGREHGQKADQLPGQRSISNPEHRKHICKIWAGFPQTYASNEKRHSNNLTILRYQLSKVRKGL